MLAVAGILIVTFVASALLTPTKGENLNGI
jgi:hypothetical protein